jgi:uncharacterized protein (UPF0332 family)
VNLEYGDCLKRGKIKPFTRGTALAGKELDAAKADLERAEKTCADGDYKWTTIQTYYSMFHSARALLYRKDLREHSHYCLINAMKALYVAEGQLPVHLVEGLQEAKDLREDADYYNRWSEAGCNRLLKTAREFLETAARLVKIG